MATEFHNRKDRGDPRFQISLCARGSPEAGGREGCLSRRRTGEGAGWKHGAWDEVQSRRAQAWAGSAWGAPGWGMRSAHLPGGAECPGAACLVCWLGGATWAGRALQTARAGIGKPGLGPRPRWISVFFGFVRVWFSRCSQCGPFENRAR